MSGGGSQEVHESPAGNPNQVGAVALLLDPMRADRVIAVLREAAIDSLVLDPAGLVDAIRSNSLGTVLMDETCLDKSVLSDIQDAIAGQPAWSNLPFTLLMDRESLSRRVEIIEELGNVGIIEHPLEPGMLIAAVRGALRSRGRQREAHANLEQRAEAEARLQQLTENLEARVAARTDELRAANQRMLVEIGERRRAEERLRDSEELYRFTVDLGQQLVWTASPEGKLLSLNPRFSELTGLDRKVDPHEGWLSVIHPEDYEQTLNASVATFSSGEPSDAEFRMRLRDGSYRRFLARAAPKKNAKGEVVRWYGYTQDIEDQRHAEDLLRESEELYRYTLELGQHMVWTAAPDGAILTMSRRFTDVTGKVAMTPPSEVVHPDDLDHLLDTWMESVRTGRKHVVEFRMRLKEGIYRYFRAHAAPRLDDEGRIIRWYGFTEDIQDQRDAEAARLTAEERYRLAARATNDAIWDWDLADNEVHWSESASDTLGYSGRNLGTTSLQWWEERVHPEDRQQAVESLKEAITEGRTRWSCTYRFRQASGEYAIFFDRGFILRDAKGVATRFVGAMTDLTERQKADEELRRMQAELIHVSRLSAMGAMASTLAHELNQPLTAVTNYVRGSRRLIANGNVSRLDEVGEALGAAEAGALRAGQIVRRLRELVARGNAAVRPEDLPKLIEDAGGIGFLDAHLLGVSHRVELDPDAQWVEVDRVQVQQVIINLIRNSMQAMQDVSAREIIISTRRISAQHVEVCVSDTGEGIPSEVRDALFSAFQGTKAEGMGIGLSISRTIIEAHGGKIWAEDREGGGSVFRFTLHAWEPTGDE